MNYYLYFRLGNSSIQVKTNHNSFSKVIDDISLSKEIYKYKFENDEGYEVVMFYIISDFGYRTNIGFMIDEVIFDED